MNSDRWQQVSKLYHDALALDASARGAFLRDACAGDEALRREVESLLAKPASAGGFVDDPPPVRLTSRMVADAGAPPMAGRRLGGYQVETRLGAGGMGEVYRARDTKLGRQVAIKILPRVFTSDPERLARFEREARMLASLNHPNIGAIFGVEDAEGIRALVLELVEGEMMTDRIARGPVPIKDALGMARQIADALDAAHERGIVHRDLKPANIKITPAGVVKVLDFGLAKAGGTGDSDSAVNLTNSPTLTMGETRDGMILGTAPYMSPEQARGKVVDKRSDVWAFGCVLYEMLTGRVAFAGGTVSDTIVAILDREPDWSLLPAGTPPSLLRLLQRCLEKDAKRRLHDIADARIEIDDALQEPSRPASGILPPAVPTRRRALGLTAAAVLLALAVGAGLTWWLAAPASLTGPSLARVMITLPAGQALEKGRFSPVALSPDGQLLVYAAAVGGGQTQLYLRALDELEARPIPATEGATTPFFSPDGRWLGFYSESSLKKVSLAGGVPLTIGETPPIWSATWGGDDHIVFATTLASSGLWDVSAEGGQPVQITTPKEGETQHGYPQILPGGTHVLFSVLGDGAWRPALLTLANREWRLLGNGRVVGEGARYLPTRHLVYAQAGGLVAAPFEPPDGDLNQPPTPLLERVERSRFGGAYFSVAATAGSLVYLPANTAITERTLLRVDREGRVVPLVDARLGYEDVAFSPDGRRVAATIESDMGRDIWIIDVERGTRIRFTTGGTSAFPVWSPDGSRLAFQSTAPGLWNLYWKPLDGSTEAQPVISAAPQPAASWPNTDSNLLPGTLPTLSGANPQFPTSWTADGSLAFHERKPNGERDIWVVGPSSDPQPFLLTPFDERSPRFSPDGTWLTYVSNESGRDEVYVQPFPGPGRKWLISTDGGIDPVWARDGRELFYRQGEQMMAVSIVTTPEFQAGRPRRLFETRFDTTDNGRSYDLAPDGRWFLMPRSDRAPAPAELHFVLNWFNEVTSRTSTAR